MKKLLSVVAFILMMDNILTPFSVALGDEVDDFGVEENITIDSEVEQEDLSDDILESDNGDEAEVQNFSVESGEGNEDIQNGEDGIQTEFLEEIEELQEGSQEEVSKNDSSPLYQNDDKEDEDREILDEDSEGNNGDEIEEKNVSIESGEGDSNSQNEENDIQYSSDEVEELQENIQGEDELKVDSSSLSQSGNEELEIQDSSSGIIESQSGSEVSSGNNVIDQEVKEEKNENEGIIEEIGDELGEEIQEIVTKIRYFFKKEGDSRYIKYGRDSNNIGTITLKDPKSGENITIMDKNLGANSIGDNGNYYQWGNNSGVKTVNSSNKTTEKAVYKDSYYSRGYNGEGKFIVGGTDYWENEAHYNNLWGNESKESSRYGACPVGYHIPTVKEWNQLLSIWGKIHTQDTSTSEMVLRYSANYATKNIHTFKGAATQCEGGESECVDEDKLSIIIDTLSDELKLPLAGSYDENGNFHNGLGVYWTSISKDGNKAGVFDMNAYIGNGTDSALMYKAQGHNIRCFQNIQPYEAPIAIEIQEEEKLEAQNGTEIGTGSKENPLEEASQENKEGLENQKQDSYSGQNIPSEFISYSLVLDTAKDLIDVEMNANGGRFSDDEEIKVVKYGYYNQETSIDVKALKQDEYRSGYDIESEIEKISPSPVGYKLMDKVEAPEKEGYIFDGWYTELERGEKVDLENLLVSEGMKVYAHWTAKEYTITWKNEDGTIKDTTKVAYGEIPAHEDAYQPSDEKYAYTFKGWEPGIKEVTGDAEYRATYTYTLRKYTITWENEDGKMLKTEQLEYGKVPVYSGDTPTKESTEEYEYIFTGWDKEISEVKGNAKYIAKYDAKEIIKEDISTLSHDDENILSGTIEKGSEGSNDGGRGGNIQNSLADSLELKTGDVESGSALDLLEEIIEVQAETGEILEYTQEDREMELAQIWETLNKQAIEGKKASHHVIVKVSAPVGAFPEGTELRITPIESLKMMQEIKDQLVENTDVTHESELVSFDISFIYTLSNGEEIELQPLEGQTVKVSFNFTYNDTLSQADSDSDKELKVYHLEEVKDESGKKTDEVEVKEVEVNKSESSDGELVVDAEKFSVYTIVTQQFEEPQTTSTWRLGVDYNEIEIPNTQNTICYTIMDRNLGATQVAKVDGNNWKKHDNEAGGYYYQYGNNYGFTLNYAKSNYTDIIPDTSLVSNSNYVNKTWVKNNERTSNLNIWGGGSDSVSNEFMPIVTNFEERQGPCPDGWHVPSAGEWGKAFYYRGSKNGHSITPSQNAYYTTTSPTTTEKAFIEFLKIDPAGEISNMNGKISSYNVGNRAILWTSSPYSDNERLLEMRLYTNAPSAGGIYDNNKGQPGLGLPIRCFKNTYECKNSSNCTLDDGVVVHNGDTITAYQAPIVAQGSSCQSQQVTCNNGTLNGSYRYSTCKVYGQSGDAQECTLPRGGTIEHGQSVTGYQSATVPYGQSCVSETRTCNNSTLSGSFEYSGCTVAEPATCSFQGQTIAHNGSLTVYSSASPTCPTTCTQGTVTCNNGTLGGDTSYTNLSCATVSKTCDSSFSLSSTGAYGTYSACTPYTSNGISCTPGTTKYKLDSCDSGYHSEDGETCIENTRTQNCSTFNIDHATATVSTFTQTWNNGTWTPATKAWTLNGSECGFTCNTNYSWDGDSCEADTRTQPCGGSIPENASAITASTYTQTWNGSSWTPTKSWTNGADICGWSCNDHYHLNQAGNGCDIDTFQITWLDGDGQTLKTETVDYNVVPSYSGPTPTKAATDQYTYTFNNSWSPALAPATVDTIYTAQFDNNLRSYTITWLNEDDSVFDTTTVEYGTVPSHAGPTKVADAEYTYTFAGWTPSPVSVTGPTSYKATFSSTKNKYLIAFKNRDGTELQSNEVEYGTTPTAPANPSRAADNTYTYTFKSWTPNIHAVSGAQVYTATYDPHYIDYTITWKDYNGTQLSGATYHYNDDLVVLADPSRAADNTYTYEFAGWTPSLQNKVTGNKTYTATYTPKYIDYTITFVNWDNSEISSRTYHYGDTITVPVDPTKPADEQYTYRFTGWSPEVSNVTKSQVYTATYSSTLNQYTATIDVNPAGYGSVTSGSVKKDWGTNISVEGNTLKIGTTTITPNPTSRSDEFTYTFSGWTNNCGAKLTGDCTITANFKRTTNEYLITFKNRDGTELQSSEFEYGTTPSYTGTPTRPADEQYSYSFSGWSPAIYPVNGVQVYTAVYTNKINKYDVIFDSDGGDYTPDTQSIEYGSTAMKPTPDPTKTGYEFDSWTLSGNDFNFSTPIIGTSNLVAKWNLVEYTITYNLDGGTNNDNNPEIYSIESGTITLQQPTKTGYTFLGWTGSNGDIPQTGVVIPTGSYGDREYNAVWQANITQYTVYHYVKKVGENIYALSKTDILTGTTDEILVFSSLAKESEFICAHYSSGSLVGTENGPGEIITETTIKGDGSTEVYLYYTRNSHKVTLSGDVGVQMLKINGSQREEAVLECGSDVPVEAVPKPGYHFVRWEEREEKEEKKEHKE